MKEYEHRNCWRPLGGQEIEDEERGNLGYTCWEDAEFVRIHNLCGIGAEMRLLMTEEADTYEDLLAGKNIISSFRWVPFFKQRE
jgi:hypothetical protein